MLCALPSVSLLSQVNSFGLAPREMGALNASFEVKRATEQVVDFSGCKGENVSWFCCTGTTTEGVFSDGQCIVPAYGCVTENGAFGNPGTDRPK